MKAKLNTEQMMELYKDFKEDKKQKELKEQKKEIKNGEKISNIKTFFKKIDVNAKTPTAGTPYSAGFDLYSTETSIIRPGITSKVHTGICISIPPGYFGAIFARSGLATKQGLAPANCVGKEI